MNSKQLNAIANNYNWSEVYNLADAYRQQQQWQPAAIAFQRAIILKPDFFWSYHHFGDVLTQLKQWQQAAFAYRRAVEIDPSFFWSWHNLGDVFLKLQQWDKAIAIYLQAIQLRRDHQLVYQKLGIAFKQRGSLEESIIHYRQSIHSSQSQIFNNLKAEPEIVLDIADVLVAQHQATAGIVLYYMALEIVPNQTQILLKVAELLQQQNQLQQSITSHQQTLHSDLVTRQNTKIVARPKPNNIPGQIIIKADRLVSPAQLENLCSQVGWSPRPLDKVESSLENSFCYITAWHLHNENQQLVSFARAVSDGVFHAVLLDILVHPDFQNQGLGKEVVKALIKRLQQSEIKDITLFASPHIVDFYHKLGFVSQPSNLQWMLWSEDKARNS